jgi:hypothetical protein
VTHSFFFLRFSSFSFHFFSLIKSFPECINKFSLFCKYMFEAMKWDDVLQKQFEKECIIVTMNWMKKQSEKRNIVTKGKISNPN